MRLDEYLETVSEQIRYAKIRSTVTEELKNHILDQAEAYEECGAFPEEALERAVREMGDPVETGVALDRIHRPQMNWGIVAAIAVLSIFSIGVCYAANIVAHDIYSWQKHALYTVIGFIMMLVFYRMDYSILAKFQWKSCVFYFGLIMLGYLMFGQEVNGMRRWIVTPFLPFGVSVSEAMLLYVPLFGATLYSFRGDGYNVLWKVIPLIIIPAFFVFRIPDLSAAVILFTCLFCLFIFAVWKDWYQISKKAIIGISGGIVLLTPLAFLGYFYFFGQPYQSDRIRAFFTQGSNGDYIINMAKNMREHSALLGSSSKSIEWFANGPTTDFLTDYILVSMCSIYGTLLTVAVIVGLLLIIMKVFHISVTQKNQLGMIVGTGCGLAFFIKTALGILMNLQLIPYVSISMPFLSYGGSGTVVSYILLGLVLSIYRYKNILPNRPENIKKRHLRLKLTWETR